MKNKIIGTVLILVLLLVVLAAAPSFVDWAKYKPMIAAKVQAETGYVLTLGGALDIRLLPSPHLVVENLTLTPPGAKAPLLSIERADVQVALLPLFGGHIVIDSVAMMKPQVNLLVDASGRPGWLTPQVREKINAPSSATPKGKTENRLALRDIYIKGASIAYDDAQKTQSYRLDDADLTIHGDGLYGPYQAEGTVSYRGKPVRLSLSTKAFDMAAQTVEIDSKLALTGLASASYDGLIGLKAPYDVQGQAKLDTPSLKKLLDFVTAGAAVASLDKPVSANGLVSFGGSKASWSNLHVKIGPAGFAGSIAASNLAAGAKTPLAVTMTLAAEQPVDLTPWLAGQMVVTSAVSTPAVKAATPAAVIPASFLSTYITLPRPLTITATVSAPAATYQGVTLKGVSLSGDYHDRNASGVFKADIPGGTLETDFALAFGAMVPAANGGVTLGNPAATYKVALQTVDGGQALAPFLPAAQVATLRPLLQGAVSLDAAGEVRGRSVTLGAGDLTLAGSTLHLQGAYSPAKDAGRDLLSVAVTADKVDIDQWLLRLPITDTPAPAPMAAKAGAKSPPAVAPPAFGQKIRDMAQRLILPFDLDVTATADRVQFKGTSYQNFSLLGGLRGPSLSLKTFRVADPDGNGIVAAGTVGDLKTLQDVNISVQAQTANLKAILSGVDPKYKSLPDSLQAANVLAQVKGDAGQADFTANVKAMDGTLDTTGTMTDMLGTPSVSAMTLRLRHPSFVELARLVQPDFNANVAIKKSVDLYVSLKRDKQVYTLTDLQASVGPADVSGTVTADLSGARPLVKAKLQVTDLPLSDLIGHGGASHAANEATPIATNEATPAAPQGHWSRAPVNVDWMRKMDAEVSAAARSVSYGTWKLENGVADLTLKNGVLDLTKLDGTLYGGQLALTGKLTAPATAGGALAVTGDLDLQNVALQSFMDSFSASHVVDGRGVLSLKSTIAASGESPAALIGALSGKGTATGKNILFNGFDLARLSRVLVAPGSSVKDDLSDFGGALHGGSTAFNSLDSAFTIAKGVVTLKPFTLVGDAATVTMPGTVDLPLWRVDLAANIQLATPKDAPALQVSIKGPLDQPAKTFGQNALKAYASTKLQSIISSALAKKGLAPAAGGTGATAVKPKDLLKNVLNGLQKP